MGEWEAVGWYLGFNLAHTSMQIFAKLLYEDYSPQYVIILRSVLLLTLNSAIILRSPLYADCAPAHSDSFQLNVPRPADFRLLAKRQFFNTSCVNLHFTSLQHLTLSLTISLFNTSPVLVFFVEALFYRKPLPLSALLLTVLAFAGVLIILDPWQALEGHALDLWVLVPVLAALMQSCGNVLLHEMRGKFNQYVVLQYTYATQLLVSAVVAVCQGSISSVHAQQPALSLPLGLAGLYFGLMSLCAYLAHFTRIQALFRSKPSRLMVYNYSSVVYSILLDLLLFEVELQWMTLLGMALTSAGLLSHLLTHSP